MIIKLISLTVNLIIQLIKRYFIGLKKRMVLLPDLFSFLHPLFVDMIWIFYYQSYFSQSETKAGFYEFALTDYNIVSF